MIVLVMGVSGSGKTTVGEHLAKRLRCSFAEGDDFHPPANVAKMESGTPLTDSDRWPWLLLIAEKIDAYIARKQGLVVACSALRRKYRKILIGEDRENVHLVYLEGTQNLIRDRMEARSHFMPPALLKSQFATLEEPQEAEHPIRIDVQHTPGDCATLIIQRLKRRHDEKRKLMNKAKR
ncbi:MAG: gluconokinase [Alphaproteobacteria bacterium]|nr:gluconokinase [Alphaproteobacteria bacterium]